MLNKEVIIHSEYITLAQLLKLSDVISSGGQAKSFLANNTIIVNDVADNRRGRKLYANDKIIINNEICLTLVRNK